MAALGSAPFVFKVCSSPVLNPTNRRKLSSAASGRFAETLSEICDKLRICDKGPFFANLLQDD